MKSVIKKFGLVAFVAAIGFSLMGCVTAPGFESPELAPATRIAAGPIHRVAWSYHPFLFAKKYVVLGAIVVTEQRPEHVLAALMNAAIEMGGHDIKHVRMSLENRTGGGVLAERGQWVTASAVVIRYTDETVIIGGPEAP